jgi:hypothetical protein
MSAVARVIPLVFGGRILSVAEPLRRGDVIATGVSSVVWVGIGSKEILLFPLAPEVARTRALGLWRGFPAAVEVKGTAGMAKSVVPLRSSAKRAFWSAMSPNAGCVR